MNFELLLWLANVTLVFCISDLNQMHIGNAPVGGPQLQRDSLGMERIKLLVGNINPF